MVELSTPVCNFGEKAHDFSLKNVDGKKWSLNDCKGEKGLLVMFLCNHCPYVQAILEKLVVEMSVLEKKGIGCVAINPNDYILILGIEKLNNNDILNIENLVSIFGVQPKNKSVSFYNQDWYLGEEFAQLSLSNKWYLIQKKVILNFLG